MGWGAHFWFLQVQAYLSPTAPGEYMGCTLKAKGESATLLSVDKGQVRARTAKGQQKS